MLFILEVVGIKGNIVFLNLLCSAVVLMVSMRCNFTCHYPWQVLRRNEMEENTRKLTFVVVFLSLFVMALFSFASIG